MVWLQILREMGSKWNPYDYSADEQPATEGDPDSLDKVDPKLVACINRTALKTAAERLECEPLIRAASIVQNEKDFLRHTQPCSLPQTSNGRSNGRHVPHAVNFSLA